MFSPLRRRIGEVAPRSKHALGYETGLLLAQKLVVRVIQALATADCMFPGLDTREAALYLTRHVADEVRVTVRMLALVRIVRCAPRGTRDPDTELVADLRGVTPDEMRLMKAVPDNFSEAESRSWFPRAVQLCGYQQLVTQLRAAWQDAEDVFGPLVAFYARKRLTASSDEINSGKIEVEAPEGDAARVRPVQCSRA